MKHLFALTSVLILAACSNDGGSLDLYYYYYDSVAQQTAQEGAGGTQEATAEPTANPANASVTQMTTDLNNVNLRSPNGGEFTFTLDGDGVIDGINFPYHATREGDSNVFAQDDKEYRWVIETYGDGHLKYSDFGTIYEENHTADGRVFAGGDTTKQYVHLWTEEELVKWKDDPTSYMLDSLDFSGSAIVQIGYNEEAIVTNSANLHIEPKSGMGDGYFKLNMPFHSKSASGDFYDVVVTGGIGNYSNAGSQAVLSSADTWNVELNGNYTGPHYFENGTGNISNANVQFYGENGVASEITGAFRYTDTKYGSFDAAFGVSK